MIRNINEKFGMAETFESVNEMASAIRECGYDVNVDDLAEGIDYEVVD